uniref:Zeta toxin domain-containing protein n=1 Tax=Angomonas deanei TaxID=59799 RepID=C6K3K3_9TRYP|nr:conserved hypothetical protein [Angomonas deanei]
MMQSPPPYVPVVEYVLKALEHPPYMYVAKLAACCTMLFLTRENPELLQELCHKWALRFRQDRSKLITHIRTRASYCVNSNEVSTELESSDKIAPEDINDGTDGESSSKDTQRNDDSEEEVFGGIRCCDPDKAVEHLLSILNTLVPMYFSWNWHRADYVIQINKEYEAYVREFILPVCTALAPEDGVDDEEHTPWLLPPHTYLDPTQSTSGFYSPTSGVGPYPVLKGNNVTETRHGITQSGGGISPVTRASANPPGAPPTELEGLGVSVIPNHFTSTPVAGTTNAAAARRGGDHRASTGMTAQQLPKFSPLHPISSGGSSKDMPQRTSPYVPGSTLSTSSMQPLQSQASGSTYSVPAMSPNVMSAGVFNTAAVYGLRFLSLGTYREALRHNTRGLVTVFHAKYSMRSNEVIETLQKITAKRLLNPMPTIAVVYAVAEPELSSLYKVGWFPTIVYTPPLSSQRQRKRGTKNGSFGHLHPHEYDSGDYRPTAAGKRQAPMERRAQEAHRRHSHLHRRRRSSHTMAAANANNTTQTTPTSTAGAAEGCRPLSQSDSLLDMAPAADTHYFEEEERVSWDGESTSGTTPASRRSSVPSPALADNGKSSGAASQIVIPLKCVAVNKSDADGGAAAVPLSATTIAAGAASSPSHLSPSVVSRPEGSAVSLPSGVSGPLSATAPMATTPTELLYGISVEDKTPVSCPGLSMGGCGGGATRSPSQPQPPVMGGSSVDNTSLPGSVEDAVSTPQSASRASGRQLVEQQQQHQPLRDMVEHDDHVIYPLRGELTVPALVEWISARGASVPRLGKLKDVSTCLKSIRQEEKFKRYRELHSAVVTLRRLQGQGESSMSSSEAGCSPNSRSSGTMNPRSPQQQQPEQPLFIFLGGGMAAGKTTAVAALATSSWWQGHKEQSVVVNADEFKLPLECELSSVEAHKHSTRAAENLLVKAINQGRSIVLDGTMMWKPFVQQVVNMVRAAHLTIFKQGPGYEKRTKVEQYFVADKARQPALPFPYKIIFLGITVDVETAVPRGFLRKFSTNRGVPISMQLRSFKMFSENFADYVAMVDETTLYNNNVFVNLEKGELPPVMAECNESTGHKLAICDEAAFQQFIKQQQINENADNVMQVYPLSPVTPEIPLAT